MLKTEKIILFFLPAKEILSLHKVIIQNRDINKQFGFDDTYYDLAKALTIAPKQGKNYKDFSKARKLLLNLIDGKIEYDEKKDQWRYKKGNQKYSIGVTAEGIKKIAIIDTLLSNRYLDNKSIIFIDEPESALHPKAINDFCEIIYLLSKCGIQFFIASHSYFVLKKMYLIAMKNKLSIPALSLSVDSQYCYDLLEGMPENEIINESIKLYNEEIEEVLK